MLNPVTCGYAGPFRGQSGDRKRGRSKMVMLNARWEMRMGNVIGIQARMLNPLMRGRLEVVFEAGKRNDP